MFGIKKYQGSLLQPIEQTVGSTGAAIFEVPVSAAWKTDAFTDTFFFLIKETVNPNVQLEQSYSVANAPKPQPAPQSNNKPLTQMFPPATWAMIIAHTKPNIPQAHSKMVIGKPQQIQTGENKKTYEKGTWNVIVTERYTGKPCTHIEKTPVRKNCRRGKIEVYDNNGVIVLTISDCLLEGVGGENRMKTNADIPFGTYKIDSDMPFKKSSQDDRVPYGPNPRLVFEPIKEDTDEAEKSGRSELRMHGGRQEGYEGKVLKRTHGCIRIHDEDAKRFYEWWLNYSKENPKVKPGTLTVTK